VGWWVEKHHRAAILDLENAEGEPSLLFVDDHAKSSRIQRVEMRRRSEFG